MYSVVQKLLSILQGTILHNLGLYSIRTSTAALTCDLHSLEGDKKDSGIWNSGFPTAMLISDQYIATYCKYCKSRIDVKN